MIRIRISRSLTLQPHGKKRGPESHCIAGCGLIQAECKFSSHSRGGDPWIWLLCNPGTLLKWRSRTFLAKPTGDGRDLLLHETDSERWWVLVTTCNRKQLPWSLPFRASQPWLWLCGFTAARWRSRLQQVSQMLQSLFARELYEANKNRWLGNLCRDS